MDARAVLVTGATGLVGRRLVRALRSEGRPVRALSRSPSRARLPEGVEGIRWDGTHPPAEALSGAEAVVHLAGEPIFGGRLTRERRRRIRDSRVQSTRAIAETLSELPDADRPRTFLCASAVGYYGSRGDALLEEDEPPGEGFLAEVCVAWEQAAARAEAAGVRTASLRLGIVLAAEGGALAAMRLPFQLGLGGRLGDGRQWFPWVHVDDVVGLFLAALSDERYRGAANAVAPHPVTNAHLTAALGRALHRPTFFRVPAFVLRLALGELADELLGSRRAVPRAATDRGFAFRHPALEGALAEALQ